MKYWNSPANITCDAQKYGKKGLAIQYITIHDVALGSTSSLRRTCSERIENEESLSREGK
jgi:hypothetical protein